MQPSSYRRTSSDRLDGVFSALADPTRRAILARLATGEASVSELAAPFEISMPAISKHLKVLQRAGLITQGREAQWRPCRLAPAPLKEVDDWLDEYRALWEARLDRLEAYVEGLHSDGQAADKAGEAAPPSPAKQNQS